MWLFSRRFDILSHIFNPRITKIVHTDPTIFQRMREFICSNMFSNTFAKDYCIFSRTFALCYGVLSLLWSVMECGCVGSSFSKFLWRLCSFLLFLNRWDGTISILIFFTNIINRLASYVCDGNIIFICLVFINCFFTRFGILIVIFSWFCNFDNWFERYV